LTAPDLVLFERQEEMMKGHKGGKLIMEREILLLNNDELNARAVKKALEPMGYKVNCRLGLSSLFRDMKDGSQVILLDVVLPDGDEIKALKEIIASHNDATVIMMTAYEEIGSKAMKEGAHDYIEKPFDVEELKATVKRAFTDMEMRKKLHGLGGAAPEVKKPITAVKGRKISGSGTEKRDLFTENTGPCSIRGFLEERLKRYLREMTNLERANLYDSVISEVEKAIISIVLDETGGNQLKASKTLGINRNTLRAKVKKYGIS
jgi:DNA-binding NtrC family response regulator